MTISVVINTNTHPRPLVIVIDLVSLLRHNQERLSTVQHCGKTYEDAIVQKKELRCSVQSRRLDVGGHASEVVLGFWSIIVFD
jgi:hypothetical protein